MIRRALAVPLWLAAASAQAGGHFEVDDAGMLDPDRCQYEFWGTRVRSEDATLWHLGPACRVGPVELGLNIERISMPGDTVHVLGPQLKWTFFGQEAEAPWSAAVSLGFASQLPRRGGRSGGQFVLPLTWRATDSLMVHANLGADWATGSGERTGRGGLAGEWALNDTVSLIAERNRAFGLWTSRIGARLSITPMISIDLSAARTGPAGVRSFSVGLNHEFGR
jgi:hypothetical protein